MAWALGHQRQPDLWIKIAGLYKALFLKPMSSPADLQTKNDTHVTGLVDADAMICRDYLVLITSCQQNVFYGRSMDKIRTAFSVWHLHVGTDFCYLPFLTVMQAVYMLSVYSKKDRSHRITVLLFSQFLLMLFSSHSKRLAGKYPWALGPLDQR
jgi:hypothetical protein